MKTYFGERIAKAASASKGFDDTGVQHSFSVSEDGVVRFLGGDRSTLLTGRIHSASEHNNKDSPVVIMAQGLGYTADGGFTPFVEAFQTNGFAVFTFDYANFGASDGFPRHRVVPRRQLEDLRAAIEVVTTHADELGADGSRLVLWGTSLGGGHVISMAAMLHNHPSIRAVVSMVPSLASPTESVLGTIAASPGPALQGLVQVVLAVLRCAIEFLWTGNLWYIPLTGPPGSAAVMQNPGDEQGYLAMTPEDGGLHGWRNAVTADSVLHIFPYRPLNYQLDQITVPCLILAAEQDSMCASKYAVSASQKISQADLALIPEMGHFDLYRGNGLKQVLSKTISFLKAHVQTA